MIGDARPSSVTLLTLDPDARLPFAAANRLAADDLTALPTHREAVAPVRAVVGRASARVARVEQVTRWVLLPAEGLPAGDELTPTMTLKRRPLTQTYAEQITALYQR